MSKKLLVVTLVLCVTGVLVIAGTANAAWNACSDTPQHTPRNVAFKILVDVSGQVVGVEVVRAPANSPCAGAGPAKPMYPGWETGYCPSERTAGVEPTRIEVYKKHGDPCVYVNGKRRCW